jgi:DNA-binding MarR family transcriptional regulator
MTLLAYRMSASNEDLQVGGHRLTLQEWRVLSIIADSGPLVPAEIRRRGTQDKSTISWAIKRLLAGGLLSKTPSADDGRTFEVSLSSAGQRYYGAAARVARAKARAMLSVLTPGELATLWQLIDKLDDGGGPPHQKGKEGLRHARQP